MARLCIFCGRAGVTREHVYPRWMTGALPGSGDFTVSQVHGTPPTHARRFSGPSLGVVAKRVCGACNHGWMSRLEDASKPVLARMIGGQPVLLEPRDKLMIARWGVKMAVMFDLTTPQRHISQLHANALFRDSIAEVTYVYLAAYRGQWSGWFRVHNVQLWSDSRPFREGITNGFIATFTLGALGIQVFSHDLIGRTTHAPGADKAPFMVRIFPDDGQPAQWPPGRELDDARLEEFAGHMINAPRP